MPSVETFKPVGSPEQPVAIIENNWPRPGLLEAGMRGEGYLGRFMGHDRRWFFEDENGAPVHTGEGDSLAAVGARLQQTALAYPDGGMIGYVSYEAGYAMVGLKRPCRARDSFGRVPDVQFLFFKSLQRVMPCAPAETHRTREYSRRELDQLLRQRGVQTQTSRARYHTDVETIREHIAAGDIYQANYTQAFDADSAAPTLGQFRRLVSASPAPYNTLLHFPECSNPGPAPELRTFPALTILGASPERLLRKTGSRLETRPIKGTVGRARDADDDRLARHQLLRSRKDQAELLMITDLERNDLGKIAEVGTVRVESIARLRRAPSVWHLESTVAAEAAPNVTWADALCALFPGGSITGAPKRRAMEIISSLESGARGVYCGTYGWVNTHGDCDFAVAIRTAVRIGNTVRLCGGGGIVYDSDPESEFYESVIKIAPMLEAFTDGSAQSPHSQPRMTTETEEAHA